MILLSTILSLSAWGADLAVSSSSLPTVEEIRQAGYFNRLDYDQPAIRDALPSFEAELFEVAEAALKLPDSDPYFRENALIFIYAGLVMDNVLDAYRQGRMTYADLTRARSYSALGVESDEVAFRRHKIVEYAERAKALRPRDVRMDSWVIGGKAKHLDPEKYADQIIRLAGKKQDTFTLISALTVTQGMKLKPSQQRILDQLVKKFTSLKSPCFWGKTKSQCRSTVLAPYAAQTGVVMLADHRLKMAQRESSPRKQKLGRFFARMLYKSTDMVWMKDSTPTWMNREILPERVKLTRKGGFSRSKLDAFWKTENAKTVYRCTSCHSSGLSTP